MGGKIVAGRLTKLACKRFLADLERASTDPDCPYYFDIKAGTRVARFLELLPHYQGLSPNTLLVLQPWQVWLVLNLFGFLLKATGKRRFRQAIVWVARKNGKSFLASGIALYMLAADNEPGPEVYCCAVTRDQARKVFGDAQKMLRHQLGERVRERFGIEVMQHAISAGFGTFRPLSSEGSSLDGLNTSAVIHDELHAHGSRDVYDVLRSSTGARTQPLEFVISTGGHDVSGIGYETYSYGKAILEGTVENDAQFVAIWCADSEDVFTDPIAWQKAHPNLGVSVTREFLEGECRKAQQVPSARAEFETKLLNRWVTASSPWINLDAWDKCTDSTLTKEQLRGESCWVGLDLASKTDLAVAAYVFPRVREDGQTEYRIIADSYLNEAAVSDERNASYRGWGEAGALTVTEGDVTDFAIIQRDILNARDSFYLREVCFDPWQAQQMSQNLQAEGIQTVEVRPTYATLSAPMKELEALVLQGRIRHDGNPVLRWCISNVVVKRDGKDNIFPSKERPEQKIDAAVAILTALARILTQAGATPYTPSRGLVFIDLLEE